MKKNAILAMFVLAVSCAGVSAAETEYKHPVAVIPYAWEKPTIDGVVDDAEWQGAFSQRALRTLGGQLSPRQARFWMMWDEENLYLAMRDPLRPGERPLQAYRTRERRGPELDVIYDDCFEIWLSAGASDPLTGQADCTAQFLANIFGTVNDGLLHPGINGYHKPTELSYDTGWEPKSRLTDKNEWEMEMVIPRASLGKTSGCLLYTSDAADE